MRAEELALAGLSANPVSDIRQLTAFPFMVNALEAGTAVAVMAGVIGWFMVLRRESFAGHALSLMAFPGASGALLIGLPAAAGYFIACGISALAIGLGGTGSRRGRSEASALTGAVQAFGLACGFMFLSLYRGVLSGYENLLFGDFLGISRGQVLGLSVVAALALAFLALVGRPLLFASVDESVARARGVPVRSLGVAFLIALGLAVAATAQITGVLLVFSLLVAPAATAQQITSRIGPSLVLSVLLGVAITWVSLALAYFYDYPVGFYITTVAFAAYVLARAGRTSADGRLARRRGPRLAEGEA